MIEKPENDLEVLQEAFDIAFILRILEDSKEKSAMKHVAPSSFTYDQLKVYDFLKVWTARIEVSVNDQLERLYFPIRPVCNYISVKKKETVMLNAVRESQQTKVTYLMDCCPELIDEM